MSDAITFTIDDVQVTGKKGQTIIEAAEDNGIYIPSLCWLRKLNPGGTCRVCTVMVNGRPQAACTQPVAEGRRTKLAENSRAVLGSLGNL